MEEDQELTMEQIQWLTGTVSGEDPQKLLIKFEKEMAAHIKKEFGGSKGAAQAMLASVGIDNPAFVDALSADYLKAKKKKDKDALEDILLTDASIVISSVRVIEEGMKSGVFYAWVDTKEDKAYHMTTGADPFNGVKEVDIIILSAHIKDAEPHVEIYLLQKRDGKAISVNQSVLVSPEDDDLISYLEELDYKAVLEKGATDNVSDASNEETNRTDHQPGDQDENKEAE